MLVEFYVLANGKRPFDRWYGGLGDMTLKTLVLNRLARIRADNLGDYRFLGDGLYELRIHYGSGHRIYFAMQNDELIILTGGCKAQQESDILIAKKYKNELGGSLC